MHPRIGPSSSEITFVSSAPRPTPTPPNVKFAQVLAQNAGSLARGAEAAMKSLPGAPLVALALRGGAPAPMMTMSGGVPGSPVAFAPGAAGTSAGPGGNSAEGPGGSGGATGTAEPSIDSSLAQSQEMNMYYLRLQEQMNAQNRTFSALSNVLKAEHDTVKNAISNIR